MHKGRRRHALEDDNTEKLRHSHATSGIRTGDPSVCAVKNRTRYRHHSHRDRFHLNLITNIHSGPTYFDAVITFD